MRFGVLADGGFVFFMLSLASGELVIVLSFWCGLPPQAGFNIGGFEAPVRFLGNEGMVKFMPSRTQASNRSAGGFEAPVRLW